MAHHGYVVELSAKGRSNDVTEWGILADARRYVQVSGMSFAYPERQYRFKITRVDLDTGKTKVVARGTKTITAGKHGPVVNPKARGLAAQPLKRDRWYRGSVRVSKSGVIQFRKG